MSARFALCGALIAGGLAACGNDDVAVTHSVSGTAPIPATAPSPDAGTSTVVSTPSATTPGPGPTSTTPLPTETSPPPPALPASVTPDSFADGEVTVVTEVHTDQQRKTISPLIYGMNAPLPGSPAIPAAVLAGTTFVRRGGDRSNTYNWETNASNGSLKENWDNDMYLAGGLSDPNAPGERDREMIAANLAGGRGSMVPFVLNGYVAGPPASNIPYDQSSFDIDKYFQQVQLTKPTPFATTPDLTDGVVYTDENIDFLKRQFTGDIYAPGATQVMIGSDNEPDIWESNYPMLQRGSGDALYASNGATIGHRLTADEFTARYLEFAKRVKQMEPSAAIIGPDHFAFDGYTMWHTTDQSVYTDSGRWFIDDFLASVKAASDTAGTRLLDTWDMHWYPQTLFGSVYAWELDNSTSPMTDEEIDTVLQGPRSYWDDTYDEHSWITDDHLHAPANILNRLFDRINAAWPGTPLGVTEYFPGGCSHVSSALGVADTLGVFGKMGVHLAAMWPHTCDLTFAFAGFELMRNADGNGLKFGDTSVEVDHPELAESSVVAATDASNDVTVLVVNKTNAVRTFGLRLFASQLGTVDVYLVDANHQSPALASQAELTKINAYAYAAPAWSASLLVFRNGS